MVAFHQDGEHQSGVIGSRDSRLLCGPSLADYNSMAPAPELSPPPTPKSFGRRSAAPTRLGGSAVNVAIGQVAVQMGPQQVCAVFEVSVSQQVILDLSSIP